MNKLIATMATTGVVLVMSASGASAGGPTCEDMFGTGWKNHGEHVLTYVNDGGAGGGQPAHLSDDRSTAPAPGASFCLDQPQNPGLHF
jgi:hypothetical protein